MFVPNPEVHHMTHQPPLTSTNPSMASLLVWPHCIMDDDAERTLVTSPLEEHKTPPEHVAS